ncbi:Curculin protein [Candidatus Saccharibacteria bacterium RAAC3_TM7_1]|nr:Curculin protein [Candidatus Saccharibacteria bacterium RAAC3_TM7_1]
MRKLTLLGTFGFLVVGIFFHVPTANAITGWKAGRIINDSTFTASTSMSASSIQSFLNAKVPTCDTNGTQISEYGGPDLNKDGKVQRWEWGKAYYNQTKFICLKNWKNSSGVSAAQIIYNVAQKYRISPKVLVVLLQKEQSLVTDTWPLSQQYKTATGYGCPDTAPCDSQYYGLENQLDWAAKMFRAIMDNSPTWYTPYVLGNNYIQYNPSSSCGGSTVNIENRATQALYNYTPYQPNKAALDAGWGTAPCGAYGNRNFYLYFMSWFGQPNANATYGYTLISQELYSDSGYTNKVATDTLTMNRTSSVYVKLVVKNTGNQTWYNDFLKIGTQDYQDRTSAFSDSSWLKSNRATRMEEPSVAAGGTATFKFKLTAPDVAYKPYDESFGVVIEGQRWLSGSFTYHLLVQDPVASYSAQNVGTTATASPTGRFPQDTANIESWADNTFYVTVKVKNTGTRPFPADTTKIGTTNSTDRTSDFQTSGWLSANRVAAASSEILPGDTATFKFSMTSPTGQSGLKNEQFGLVIEDQRWITNNIASLGINIGNQPPSSLIHSTPTLLKTEYLSSSDNRFRLVLQRDGNLVLYSVTTGKPLWNTRTYGKDGSRLVLQSDGNLVLYTSTNKPLWNTRTYGAK